MKKEVEMWHFECKLCKNLNKLFKTCEKSLFKPPVVDNICIYFKEERKEID